MSFSKRLEELYETVMRMVFEKYGVEELFESFKNSSFHLLRLIKYKAREMGDTDVGLTGHTDSTILTMLHQNEVHGLQIQTKQGHWIALKPSESSFVVIAGDGLKVYIRTSTVSKIDLMTYITQYILISLILCIYMRHGAMTECVDVSIV